MSEKTIKLTIQEIVRDFETLVRYDECLNLKFDLKRANDDDIEKFHSEMLKMTEKYIPNYERHVDGSVDEANYDNALKLYEMLYENFREIFYKLI